MAIFSPYQHHNNAISSSSAQSMLLIIKVNDQNSNVLDAIRMSKMLHTNQLEHCCPRTVMYVCMDMGK